MKTSLKCKARLVTSGKTVTIMNGTHNHKNKGHKANDIVTSVDVNIIRKQ